MSKLDRFLKAQEKQYEIALNEIKSGKKQTCWIWYIFPQIKGLAFSDMSKIYDIENVDEAIEYLNNDILRTRLMEICQALLDLGKVDINQVMGFPDDLKLKSSMTLFKEAEAKSLDDEKCDNIFQKVLDQFFDGEDDPKTLVVLQKQEFEKEFGTKIETKEEINMNENIIANNIKIDNIDSNLNINVQKNNTIEDNEITINKMMTPETPGNDNDEIINNNNININEETKLKEKKDFRITSLIVDEDNNEQRDANANTHSNDLKDLKDEGEDENKCCQVCIII